MRDTTTIITPFKKVEIVLNSYITGFEKRAITDIFLNKDLSDVEKYHRGEEKAFEIVIVSIDKTKSGDTVNDKPFSITEAVLNMPLIDTNFIIKACNDITSNRNTEEKKTS